MEFGTEEQEIVIVGAGICGLSTALALHRKGIPSLVLERSDSLRQTGAAISILDNGWRALDQLGVGDELRKRSVPILRSEEKWIEKGKQELQFMTGEARCSKRVDLIKALADALPPETIRFGCQIVNVKMDSHNMLPTLHSYDGKFIRSKVRIGCDGSKSIVAQFLGLKPVKSFALCTFRGLTSYPSGHSFAHEFVRIRKKGMLMGRTCISSNLVYWFVTQSSTPFGEKLPTDPELIKTLTLKTITGFPTEIVDMVKDSHLDSLSFSHLKYRQPWEIFVGNFCKGPKTVAGDAMHVIGPFLAQGGSAGIEDAIVLARNVAEKMGSESDGFEIGKAFGQYVEERRMRVLRLSVQAYLVAIVLEQTESVLPLMKFGAVMLMKILFSDQSGHTKSDCGKL